MNVTVNGKTYTLQNPEKVNRAIYGTVTSRGALEGGLPNREKSTPEEIIAAYDRLGGLILANGSKVLMGSFYDFDKKSPRPEPKVRLVFRDLQGVEIIIDEDGEVPLRPHLSPDLCYAPPGCLP